jgi:hypothetical protein
LSKKWFAFDLGKKKIKVIAIFLLKVKLRTSNVGLHIKRDMWNFVLCFWLSVSFFFHKLH